MKIGTAVLLPALLLICAACDQPVAPRDAIPSTGPFIPIANMISVRAGSFLRDGEPVSVSRDYWLGKYEVTQAEFSGLLGRNPSHFKDEPKRPVEKVSFLDATAYCAALTKQEREAGRLPDGFEYRLPTETEWELACRAGSTNRFGFGDAPEDADPFAWTAENSGGTTHPVGLKQPNAWGFHDLHGNVWEWCLDWFTPTPEMASNPQMRRHATPRTFKIFKGGGWNQDAEFAGAANKFMMEPDKGIHFVGFRVALGAPVNRGNVPAPLRQK